MLPCESAFRERVCVASAGCLSSRYRHSLDKKRGAGPGQEKEAQASARNEAQSLDKQRGGRLDKK